MLREDCELFVLRKKLDFLLLLLGVGELLDEVEWLLFCVLMVRLMSLGWVDCCCCWVSWLGVVVVGLVMVLFGVWLEMIVFLLVMILRDVCCFMVVKVIVDFCGVKGGFGGKLSRGKDGDCY